MKRVLTFLVCMFLMVCANQAGAIIVNFDDIFGYVPVTNQYSSLGINFEQTYELDTWNTSYAPVKYPGDHIAYTPDYNSAIFKFDNVIDAFSLIVTASYLDLTLEAYDVDSNLLKLVTQYIPMGNWNSMSIDLTGLSSVRKIVLHDTGNQFGFDDVTFSYATAPIPEPISLILLGTGLLGLIGLRKKVRT